MGLEKRSKSDLHELCVLRVLTLTGEADIFENPFVRMLSDSLRQQARVDNFTWPRALIGRYDVLHLHWPEHHLRSPNPLKRIAQCVLFFAMLYASRLLGRVHVSTIHNLEPHVKGSSCESNLVSRWLDTCDAHVYLTEVGLTQSEDALGKFIPHGDYRPFVDEHRHALRSTVLGRLLFVGLVSPYKRIESLLTAFDSPLVDGGYELTIRGRAVSEDYKESIQRLAAITRGIKIDLSRALTDDEIVEAISSSEAVVLPYSEIYNSGVALLALTIGIPIVVTSSNTMEELSQEVGSGWVIQLVDGVQSGSLARALDELRHTDRTVAPNLSARQWDIVGRAHLDLYRDLLREKRPNSGE